MVPAGSLDQALHCIRRRHGEVNIHKAEPLGMSALLAGSLLD
jgi:hypothetical protein